MTVDIEELRGDVERIGEAVKDIKGVGIKQSVLYLLIQRAAGTDGRGKYIPIKTIEAVMDGMDSLEEYVFDADEDTD